MKKSVAAALAAAAVIGVSSTSFAAIANPFTDVPAGHWAYQSIEKLRVAGVIDGYTDEYGRPNSMFRGDRNITRYEAAQMIARALAKNPTGANKAELDRLVAEFRDELDALGVRVSNLEKYADKVTWEGEMRYRYWNNREKLPGTSEKWKRTTNNLQLRLFPTAEVNDHWKLKARITASGDPSKDTYGNFKLTYGFAEGNYDKLTVMLGKMPFYTNVDNGMVMDDFFSGAAVTYGSKVKLALMAGRWDMNNADVFLADGKGDLNGDDAADYQGGELSYGSRDNFYIGAGYHHFRSEGLRNLYGYGNKKNAGVWTVGASYNFGGNLTLKGAYARNTKAQEFKKAYNIELAYKGANREKGSWGAGVAYRYVGQNVGIAPTYDSYWDGRPNKKGVEFYATWSPFKNTLTEVHYLTGKTLDTKKDTQTFVGRVSFFF